MPFVFAIIGLVFLIAGVRGGSVAKPGDRHPGDDLLGLLKNDLLGEHNFVYWIVSILAIGSLGYIDGMRNFSRALLVLVLLYTSDAADERSSVDLGGRRII